MKTINALTTVGRMKVHRSHSCFRLEHLIRGMMGLLRSRVQLTLTRLQALPSPRLVLIIRIVFLVLEPQSLCLFHERPFLALRQQPGGSTHTHHTQHVNDEQKHIQI